MGFQNSKERQLAPEKARILNQIFDIKEPPVARCRLLSHGMEIYHRLYAENAERIEGDQGCLACGHCIDSCPVLRREPQRRDQTLQRTSMALEAIVGPDCEQCFSCPMVCPQVDMAIKDYIVDERIVEVIPQSRRVTMLDNYFMVVVALIIGVILGVFIAI